MTNKKIISTKVVTGPVRISYEHVWEPQSVNGGTPKYGASFIIDKKDTETIEKIVQLFIV